MQQYFDAQMRLLTQAGKQFAEHYPEHAGQLNIDSLKERDPHVERLLEGVAYLTAHIQKNLDSTLPEVSEQVLRQLCPSMLNFYPSTATLKFYPKSSLQESIVVPKGKEISSSGDKSDEDNESDKASSSKESKVVCAFTTTSNTVVVPLEIDKVTYQDAFNASEIRISFKWLVHGDRSKFDLSTIRLFLQGDTPLTSSLFHFLTTGVEHIKVDFGQGYSEFNTYLKNKSCELEFLENTGAILPNSSQSHPGYALLLDYFNARERFDFLKLTGLDNIEFPENAEKFELVFKSQVKMPPGHQLNSKNIQLNCVPIVNLYKADAEPIRLEANRTDYLVVANRNSIDSIFVYSVNKVTGIDKQTATSNDYIPRYKSVFGDDLRLFTVNIKDIGAQVPSQYIQVPFEQSANDESLSVQIHASNAGWPRHVLREGDLKNAGENLSNSLTVGNISRPSSFKEAPTPNMQWKFISLLNLKFASLCNADDLKRILALFDWSDRTENRRRIESIQHISTHAINQIKRGVFISGVEIKLVIDESKFVCKSDIYHFCTLLHQFFVMYAPINQSVQTKVECIPSYNEFVWQIEPGKGNQL
ncbi:type VI secretion system baseplate subunit TssF [Flocculibacter collagenilyticus]|uniref:type VI secretion system baseplate subunit TssF n=1 Tax=Flocculibacter collagenilyticus TaxID=2744479 RepID=UPI0018F3532A|nr:type VI secretion system baseplate subunit TssF [Flocculibacter collagenilyticus]